MKLKSYIDKEKGGGTNTSGAKKRASSGAITFIWIVLFSTALWSIHYLQSKTQMTIKIPINYDTIKTKYHPKQELPQYITINVKDKVINILKARKDVYYTAKGQKTNNSYKLIIDEKMIRDFATRFLPSSSEIISISPSKIEIPLDLKSSKNIPVIADLDTYLRNGYTVCKKELSPNTITIYGDKETLDGIDSLTLAMPIKKDINKNIDLFAKVVLPKGVTTSTDSIRIKAEIEMITQMEVSLPIDILGVPNHSKIYALPSNAKVTISMPISKLKELKSNKDFPIESQIAIGIIYNNDLDSFDNNSIEVKMIEKPEWIIDYTITPSKIQYIIEK